MKTKMRIPKRTYTAQFREAAVRQVMEAGRSASEVARSLDLSPNTLGNGCDRHGAARRTDRHPCGGRAGR